MVCAADARRAKVVQSPSEHMRSDIRVPIDVITLLAAEPKYQLLYECVIL